MKKYRKTLFICIILLLFSIICYFARLQQSKIDSLNLFIYQLSKGNQIRSIIAAVLIVGLGLGTLMNMNLYSSDAKLLILLSTPVGVALWGILSILVLLSGIRYSATTMFTTCIILEILIFFVRRRKKIVLQYNTDELLNICMLVFGIICVLSTGIFYVFSAGDTITYIDILGKAFVIEGGFSEHFETIFLSTGIALAPLSSLTYMLGSNNIYLIHSMFLLNFFFFFWYVAYKKIADSIYKKHSEIISFICVLLILSMPPILYLSGWIISNVYIMCYLFILAILFLDLDYSSKADVGSSIIIGIFCVFFVYLRSDAAITLSCFVLSGVIEQISSKKMICTVILPSIFAMILYYGKIYLILGTDGKGLFLDVKTIGAMLFLLIVMMIYYIFFRNKRFLFLQENLVLFVTIMLLLVIFFLYIISPEVFLRSINVYNINITDISSQGGFWGGTGIFILMMLLLARIYNSRKIKCIEFLVVILVLTNVIMGPLRAYLGMEPRIGMGDSFNRAFISYLPLSLWGIYDRIFVEK